MLTDLSAEDVAPSLRSAVLRLGRRLRVERDHSALSNHKVAILSHLSRDGASTPAEICRTERQRPQSLTRAFAALESEGLIERSASSTDARSSVLMITAEGRDALRADMHLRDERLIPSLRALKPAELGVLAMAADILDRLGTDDDH